LGKMPGDRWQQFANLRALLAWMWAHPGRPLLFMGGEIAQNEEWRHDSSVDWHLLGYPEHAGVQALVRALNAVYRAEPALWEQDFDWPGFRWIDPDDSDHSVLSFLRFPASAGRPVACLANLTPVPRRDYRVGLSRPGLVTLPQQPTPLSRQFPRRPQDLTTGPAPTAATVAQCGRHRQQSLRP